MEVFRLTREKYSKHLYASGAANRWNLASQFVIYTASSRSLCTLEQLVHLSGVLPSSRYNMMVIEIRDAENTTQEIKQEELPKHWRTLDYYHELQSIGSKWYKKNEDLVLRVPSVIIPSEYNYIINTTHKLFSKKLRLKAVEDYFWEKRLFDR